MNAPEIADIPGPPARGIVRPVTGRRGVRPPRLIATTLLVFIWLGGAQRPSGRAERWSAERGRSSLVAHATGIAAGYGAAIMLILMSRSPWLERGVGTYRLSRWHGLGGQLVIILVVVHTLLAVQSWAEARSTDRITATKDVLSLPGLTAALVGTVILLLVGLASLRSLRRRISYERWHFLHLLTYLAVALAFAHQLAGSDLAGRVSVQIAWSLLYTYAFALVLRWRVLTALPAGDTGSGSRRYDKSLERHERLDVRAASG
jgi:DMSO/TMAO reductase YedYZ heme-binding membrane subunit